MSSIKADSLNEAYCNVALFLLDVQLVITFTILTLLSDQIFQLVAVKWPNINFSSYSFNVCLSP